MAVSLGINIKQNSQNIAERSSNITVSVYCWWSGGSYNINIPGPAGWLKIDGVRYDFRNTFNDNRTTSGEKTLFTKTLDVLHDDEGVKTVTCSAYFATGVSSGNITANSSKKLEDIPRYTRVVEADDFTDEENPVIKYANYAGSATTSIQAAISVDGQNPLVQYRTLSKTADAYTFQLTSAERNALLSAASNVNDLPVYFLLKTTIGSDSGVTSFPVMMHVVNAHPVVNPVVVDINTATTSVTKNSNVLVALQSIASVTLNASAMKGATIKSKKVEQDSVILTGDGEFLVTSTTPISITVEDSRGNVTKIKTANQFVPYINPLCSIEHTMPDGEGEMPLTVTGKAYNGAIGSTTNDIVVQYRSKPGYGEFGNWVTIGSVTRTGNDFVAKTIVTGLDYKAQHTFQARVIDAINTNGILSTEQVFVAVPVFDWGKDDFRFNVPVSAPAITDLEKPENDSDAANKGYVDSAKEELGKVINTKISMTQLWENGNVQDSFASTTISVPDLSKYDIVRISFEMIPGGSSWDIHTFENYNGHSERCSASACFYDSAVYVTHRPYTINWANNSIAFEDAKQNGSTKNDRMIPFKIYGIKGVVSNI